MNEEMNLECEYDPSSSSFWAVPVFPGNGISGNLRRCAVPSDDTTPSRTDVIFSDICGIQYFFNRFSRCFIDYIPSGSVDLADDVRLI